MCIHALSGCYHDEFKEEKERSARNQSHTCGTYATVTVHCCSHQLNCKVLNVHSLLHAMSISGNCHSSGLDVIQYSPEQQLDHLQLVLHDGHDDVLG